MLPPFWHKVMPINPVMYLISGLRWVGVRAGYQLKT